MIDSFEYSGDWWLSGFLDHKVSGTIRFSHDTGITLDLIGTFEGIEALQRPPIAQTIHGTSTNGKPMSLHGCYVINQRRSTPGMMTCSYLVAIAYVGAYFSTDNDIRFQCMDVSLSHLDEWVGMSGLTVDFPDDCPNKSADIVIKYLRPDPVVLPVSDDYSLTISNVAQFSGQGFNQFEASIKEQTTVRVEASKPTSHDDYSQVIQHLQSFLSLAVRKPVHVLSLEGRTDVNQTEVLGKVHHPPVSVYYQAPYLSNSLETVYPFDMLFSYRDVAGVLPVLLSNWYSKQDRLQPVCGAYFGVLGNPHLYLEQQFLGLVQSIEAFHARFRANRYMAADDYVMVVYEPLLQAIPGNVSEDHRKSLIGRLKYGNEYSLRTRLRQLIDHCAPFFPQLADNKAAFVSAVADTRNYLTHYDQTLQHSAARGKELWALIMRLKVLLEVSLANETGLDTEQLRDLCSRNRRIQQEVSPPKSSFLE